MIDKCEICEDVLDAFLEYTPEEAMNLLRDKNKDFLKLWHSARAIRVGEREKSFNDQWVNNEVEYGMTIETVLWVAACADFQVLDESKLDPEKVPKLCVKVVKGLFQYDGQLFDGLVARPGNEAETPPRGWRRMVLYSNTKLRGVEQLLGADKVLRKEQKKVVLNHHLAIQEKARHQER